MTESFEDVCASYDDCTWIGRNGVEAAISRLQKAHDHEIEQLCRSRFREGYEAGQRSMDAEHYAVALRLKHLPLDEDSHGNLSQIARAVWHGDFGWTKGACDALRDELVRLLGGVHEIESGGAASCACDAGCDCGCEQPQTVTYDVLGNERHKAVCELQNTSLETGSAIKKLAHALGVKWNPDNAPKSMASLQNRLIHLLGGDEPLPNISEPNLPKSAEVAKPESAGGGEITITDELRKWASTEVPYKYGHQLHAIADRIDEQERKLRKQRDGFRRSMIAAQDLLKKRTDERDEARAKVLMLDNEVSKLQAKLDDMRKQREHWADEATEMFRLFFSHEEYCLPNNPSEMVATEVCNLRHKLEDIRVAMNCAVGWWDKSKERERELQKKLDKVTKEANRHRWEYCETCEVSKTCDDLQKKLDAIQEALDG